MWLETNQRKRRGWLAEALDEGWRISYNIKGVLTCTYVRFLEHIVVVFAISGIIPSPPLLWQILFRKHMCCKEGCNTCVKTKCRHAARTMHFLFDRVVMQLFCCAGSEFILIIFRREVCLQLCEVGWMPLHMQHGPLHSDLAVRRSN